MEELRNICLTLRNNMGSEHVISQTIERYEQFMEDYPFSTRSLPLDETGRIISGKNIIENENIDMDKHVVFTPQYFDALLLKQDALLEKYENLLDEIVVVGNVRGAPAMGERIIRQNNLLLYRDSTITFEMTIPKGTFEILAITEPNAFLTMRILNQSTGQYYVAEKEESVYKWFEFEDYTPLRIIIENVSRKDASIALFHF